jgi:hypothetical protein
MYKTYFWITIHEMNPVSLVSQKWGQVQGYIESLICVMEELEKTSPGEFRLKLNSDVTPWDDENEITEMKNTKVLYALDRGQSRLNELGFLDSSFANNQVDFKKYLATSFSLKGTQSQLRDYLRLKKTLKIDKLDLPTVHQVFSAIANRVRFLNAQLENKKTGFLNQTELQLYSLLVDKQAEVIGRRWPSMFNRTLILKMERSEPAPAFAAEPKKPATKTKRSRGDKKHFGGDAFGEDENDENEVGTI